MVKKLKNLTYVVLTSTSNDRQEHERFHRYGLSQGGTEEG